MSSKTIIPGFLVKAAKGLFPGLFNGHAESNEDSARLFVGSVKERTPDPITSGFVVFYLKERAAFHSDAAGGWTHSAVLCKTPILHIIERENGTYTSVNVYYYDRRKEELAQKEELIKNLRKEANNGADPATKRSLKAALEKHLNEFSLLEREIVAPPTSWVREEDIKITSQKKIVELPTGKIIDRVIDGFINDHVALLNPGSHIEPTMWFDGSDQTHEGACDIIVLPPCKNLHHGVRGYMCGEVSYDYSQNMYVSSHGSCFLEQSLHEYPSFCPIRNYQGAITERKVFGKKVRIVRPVTNAVC